jgi:transcriptional antiterminator
MYQKHRQNLLPYAIDKYMQECMYYITAIRKLGTRNKIPYKKYVLFIKASMAAELIKGISKGLVTKTKFHSYAMGLLKR